MSFEPFLEPEALRINEARLGHLACVGLDFSGKRVLEVGAGIGLHTAFFEDRGCEVLSTDGSPTNVAEMLRRYPARQLGVLDLDEPVELSGLGRFDVVYCYGTLYHLRDPAGALTRLAKICDGQILVETLVFPGEHAECHRVVEPLTANQAIRGIGCRPTRRWVMEQLRQSFGYAYTTLDQPNYPDFVTDWDAIGHYGNLRAIFVGSKSPLDHLPGLTADLPARHRNAVSASEPPHARVWIDVGAYHGDYSLAAAKEDPFLLVHAFEPNPITYEMLRDLPPNYRPHGAAIAEHDGTGKLYLNRFAAASSLLPMDEEVRHAWIDGHLLVEEREIVVPTVRLDTFMKNAGINRVEFLKIDAQGGDFVVVRSAGDRLGDIDRIQLEVAVTPRQLYSGASDKQVIVTYLEARGFRLMDAQPQSHGQEENLVFERLGPPAQTIVSDETVPDAAAPETWSYSILRRKWGTVPATDTKRVESSDLAKLSDPELLAAWDEAYRSTSIGSAYNIRGWYHDLYRDKLSGRKVLDLGCGMGTSTIHFAEHGARLTFADIVEDNVDFVRRVCSLKHIDADFLYIESNDSFQALAYDYDYVLAIGSLINSPLQFTRDEIQAVLPHLRRPARWLHLAYPKARWVREGSLPFSEWGNITDGEGTPWMVYHDREAIDYLFSPYSFEMVFECEWHNSDFNWFDIKIS